MIRRARSLARTFNGAGFVRRRPCLPRTSPQNSVGCGLRDSSSAVSWSTPLAQSIGEAVKTTGPVSIAAYMRQCLTSTDGYYTSSHRERDQIGRKGDFVTSPEISQIFGELVGIWLVSQWMAQGRRSSGVELIEVGPGKGTLMDDILRTIRNFPEMSTAIESIYLVEASKGLRRKQLELLCGPKAEFEDIATGWRSYSKYRNIPVTWYETIRSIPNDASKMPLFIAHEFFDALPIHAFQSVAPSPVAGDTLQGLHGPIRLNKGPSQSSTPQWRELQVTIAKPKSTLSTSSRPGLAVGNKEEPEFQLTLAKASTPSSLLLPETSERYKSLKNKPHSTIEISPESQEVAADFAHRIGGGSVSSQQSTAGASPITDRRPSGAALVIDYGPTNTIPTNTLRGILSHKQVSPFSRPGEVDLSADVDFTALADAAIDASQHVEVHGPIEQGEWLQRMGIHERTKALIAKTHDQSTRDNIHSSVQRLTERGGGAMGKIYKVMAIVPENGGQRPVGFGGSVQD